MNPTEKKQGPDPVKKGSLPTRPNPRVPGTKIAIAPVTRELTATHAEDIKELPATLKPAFAKLHALIVKQVHSELSYYFDIGMVVQGLEDQQVADNKRGGITAMIEALAKALDVNSRMLFDAKKLVSTYTAEECDALIRQGQIRWGHLRHLVQVDNKSVRQKLTDRVVDENLTVDELVRAMPGIAETKPRGPGRSPKSPRDIANALAATISTANALNNRFENAIFCEAFDLPSQIQDTPPDQVTQEMRTQIEEAAAAMETVSATATMNAKRLRDAMAHFAKIIDVDSSTPQAAGALPAPKAR
jgi:hypothetical protein